MPLLTPGAELGGKLCRKSAEIIQVVSICCFSLSNPPENAVFSKRNFWHIKPFSIAAFLQSSLEAIGIFKLIK